MSTSRTYLMRSARRGRPVRGLSAPSAGDSLHQDGLPNQARLKPDPCATARRRAARELVARSAFVESPPWVPRPRIPAKALVGCTRWMEKRSQVAMVQPRLAVVPDVIDAARLEAMLAERVDGEVRFDKGTRAAYSTDASNFRQVPIGVVIPRTPEAAVAAVAVARECGAPMLSRGGGTSLAGQCTNTAV